MCSREWFLFHMWITAYESSTVDRMMIHSRGYILLLKKSIPYRLEAGPTSVPYESPMVGQLYPHILDFSFTRLIVEDMESPSPSSNLCSFSKQEQRLMVYERKSKG
jgi:hypothetical protein